VTARRTLLAALGAGALVVALSSFAQQPAKIPRLSYIAFGKGPETEAFVRALHELGYIEGRNIIVDYRFAEGHEDRLPSLVQELTGLHPNALVAADPPSFRAAIRGAGKIPPIVTRFSSDPVASGFAASLAHPGGNVTGVFSLYSDLAGKRVEILKEAVPSLSRAMVLLDPHDERSAAGYARTKRLAHRLGVETIPAEASSADKLERAFERAQRAKANGMLVIRAPLFVGNTASIARLAARFRLPAIYDDARYVDAGGLMSYGSNVASLAGRLAVYADKILKGARPSDLPIEQPETVELVVNMKTAKALGINIPQLILVRADRVIE